MINYNLTINTSVDVRFIGTPTDVRLNRLMHIMRGPITTQSTSVVFENLNASTAYTFVIEAVSRRNSSAQIGVRIANLLLQTDPGTLFICEFSCYKYDSRMYNGSITHCMLCSSWFYSCVYSVSTYADCSGVLMSELCWLTFCSFHPAPPSNVGAIVGSIIGGVLVVLLAGIVVVVVVLVKAKNKKGICR